MPHNSKLKSEVLLFSVKNEDVKHCIQNKILNEAMESTYKAMRNGNES